MQSKDSKEEALKKFRVLLQRSYVEKGVLPPRSNSEKERELFEQWLRGKEKLEGKP